MLLTDQQLIDLTHRRRPSTQRAVLDGWGMRYRVRPDGSIAITWNQVDAGIGGPPLDVAEPDFSAIVR